MSQPETRRGRPKIHADDDVLEAALRDFAVYGFEGTSLRSLNAELGLSHGTINQRFGTKERLYLEAVDYGFQKLLQEVNSFIPSDVSDEGPLEELRLRWRAFLLASHHRPHLTRLINIEGIAPSKMLNHIYRAYIEPAMRPTRRIIQRLADDGVVRPLSDRATLFLLSGAISAFSLEALSSKFDKLDGKLKIETYVDDVVRILIDGIRTQS